MRRRRAVRSAVRRLLIVLASVAALAAPASAAAQVSVFPLPGSRFNLPATQVTFRGVAPGAIGAVTVTGSKSGAHAGLLEADSDGAGASFVPSKPFDPGETMTVQTGLAIAGVTGGTFSFAIAHPGTPPPPMALPQAPAGTNGVQHLRSRPDLLPPSVTLLHRGATSEGDIFLAPQYGPDQDGPMIIDPYGNLVWFHPTPLSSRILTTDFRVQDLYGQPVLTWWQGTTNHGSGRGEGVIYNRDYQQQAIVHAGNGLQMGLHEFMITPQGDAYFVAASPVWLHGYARPIMDGVVQEVDIKTGLVLFEWHALDHVRLSQSYKFGPTQGGQILDPYHINSVSLTTNGNLLVSMRNTSTVYEIDHQTGAISWQLGGKDSSFKMGPGTTTAFQHDAVMQADGTLTIFDDGAGPPRVHSYSRGIHVALNDTTMTATLIKQYAHAPNLSANFEGSAQTLPGGDMFLGWGQQPYFSEYTNSGQQDFDARFTSATSSYRAYRFPWSAQPPTTPALSVAVAPAGTLDAYESWNGATDVTGWRILAGPSAGSVSPVREAAKYKFESVIAANSGEPDVAVQALGDGGKVLATSPTVTVAPHLAIYGHSAFVAPSALAGIPVSCLSSRPCSATVSVTSGSSLLAGSGHQRIGAESGSILYFRLSPGARTTLAHASGNRLPVQLTVRDSSGMTATASIDLIAFHTTGPSPARKISSTHDVTPAGTTDFVSSSGVGGVLAACQTAITCNTKLTVAIGQTIVATTGTEHLGAHELGYLIFHLNSAGRSLLSKASSGQLGAQIQITGGPYAIAAANIALVRFT